MRGKTSRIGQQVVVTLLGMAMLTLVSVSGSVGAEGTEQAAAVRLGAAIPAQRTLPSPKIRQWWIPFGPKRKHQMAAYSKRHYGKREWRLRRPKVIVEHMAVTPDVGSIWNTFAPNRPDPELGEHPNTCAHFAVSRSGRIFQLVGLNKRCRHTVGLNQTAIGIEHVGYRDRDLLGNRRQMRASLRLTRWLRCRYRIGIRDVIGHNESLRSPYHRERIRRLRHQTHGDMRRSSMRRYRLRLHRAGRCPA